MKYLYLFLLAFFSILFLNNQVYSQEIEDKTTVVFIKDFSADDYYTLLDTDSNVLSFEIVETCIPKGLLAIKFKAVYNDKQVRDFTQTLFLRLLDKEASYTSYSLDDMRKSCSEYRKEIINE